MEPIWIDRPPRLQPTLPIEEREIPSPPEPEGDGHAALLQMGLPLLTIMGYALVSMLGGRGRSPWMLLPMGLAVIASAGFSLYQARQRRHKNGEARQAYQRQLAAIGKEIEQAHDQQRRFYQYNYPDSRTAFAIVNDTWQEGNLGTADLRTRSRLWERRPTDPDFAVLRLGLGTLPSTVIYQLNGNRSATEEARAAEQLANRARFVTDIPILLRVQRPIADEDKDEDAADIPYAPFAHAIGVAGAAAEVYPFIQGLLAHYVIFQPSAEAKLVVLGGREEPWKWTADLPHCAPNDDSISRFFYDESTPDELESFLETLRQLLVQRQIELDAAEDRDNGRSSQPFLLTVVDLLDWADDWPDMTLSGGIPLLLNEGGALGGAVIFLVPQRSKIPSQCQAVIEIEETVPASAAGDPSVEGALYFRLATTGVNAPRFVGPAEAITSQEALKNLATYLAHMRLRQSYTGLPRSVPYLSLVDCGDLTELSRSIESCWGKTAVPEHANWLGARLGLLAGNKVRTLRFAADQDGVHGLIAGGTGSGKSELLIAMLLDMAATYAPTMLNFVLVDYKGGGAFEPFRPLPHCVDLLTNLEVDGVTRMFTAIQAEMGRRQKMNADTQTKDIVAYHRQGYHQRAWPDGRPPQPYPFLFIVIDEFAELMAAQPEFKAALESITRVGRAQGVSLLLASQRPSGVTDQMRSNIKLRICLRVENIAESRELLRREDAALLPSIPGRGYVQVGNQGLELVQVAYTGDAYRDPRQPPPPVVIWPGRQTRPVEPEEAARPLYEVLIGRLAELAHTHDYPRQYAPWPRVLPMQLSLAGVLATAEQTGEAITSTRYLTDADQQLMMQGRPSPMIQLNGALGLWLNGEDGWIESDGDEKIARLRVVAGLVDDPAQSRQKPLVAELGRGHLLILGASGWGKTTLVHTLLVSLMASRSPAQVHIYVLALGGRSLTSVAGFPHVGAVIHPDEESYVERVQQLLREMEHCLAQRKALLSRLQVADWAAYQRDPDREPLPAVVWVIDQVRLFQERFQDAGDTFGRWLSLGRQGRPYGIHLICTATRLSDVDQQVLSLCSERWALKLGEASDYRSLFGSQIEEMPEIAGRGVYKEKNRLLSFQGALAQAEDTDEIGRVMRTMTRAWQVRAADGIRPFGVEPLPKGVLLRDMWLARETGTIAADQATLFNRFRQGIVQNWGRNRAAEQADWLQAMLGVKAGGKPRVLTFEAKRDGVHGLVAGGTGSGKSELLMALVVSLALDYDPRVLNFVLVDYKGGGAFKPLEGLPHCIESVTNLDQTAVQRLFAALQAEMKRRQKMNAMTQTKDIVAYRQAGFHQRPWPDGSPPQDYPHLFLIIDEYAEMISGAPEFKAQLESIARVGRAQGVHLLLAAQRPIGVTDQMRANIKYRICLRVEGEETSREMLRRPDAAFLPSGLPGRGYLQIGHEAPELVQVAYTGERYEVSGADGTGPAFYDVVVDLAQRVWQGLGRERMRAPWPPMLPERITRHEVEGGRRKAEGGRGGDGVLVAAVGDWQGVEDKKGRWLGDRCDWRASVGVIDDVEKGVQRPLVVDLARGHGGIFGAAGWGKTTFVRSLVMGLAVGCRPVDLHVHVLDLGGRSLLPLLALPHVGSVILPDERGYEEQVAQLLGELERLIAARKQVLAEAGVNDVWAYNAGRPESVLPVVLLVIDHFVEFMESFGEGEESLLVQLIRLLRQGKAFGVVCWVTAEQANQLPPKLFGLLAERVTLVQHDVEAYRPIVGGTGGLAVPHIAGRGLVTEGDTVCAFQTALPVGWLNEAGELVNGAGEPESETGQIREIARRMQGEVVREGWPEARLPWGIAALPEASLYRQVLQKSWGLLGERPFWEELETATQSHWDDARRPEAADWLRVILGVTSGNRLREIYWAASGDGAHGLVAGGTGSGKSELLMTLIVGLSLSYPPDLLNFVLVDYKGGGAFEPFAALPHCVDLVTNLNRSAVVRMFTAINAEIRRRQAFNVATQTKDIVDYRRKGFHQRPWPDGSPPQDYPHLFIIIDEYAEMIDDQPAFLQELESITRVGRAQGVTLLLAAQRPKGVTDQMRANIKLKLCLRVEQVETSRELLRRPDAALLPSGLPGRGYVQVGNGGLGLMQVSWTGEVIKEKGKREKGKGKREKEGVRLFEGVVEMVGRLCDGDRAARLWPRFLPNGVGLGDALWDGQRRVSFFIEPKVTEWLDGEGADGWGEMVWREAGMRPVVGLIDDPVEASQRPWRLDLRRGHVGVFGAGGWGKSWLVRTLLASLAVTHRPDEVQMFVVDMAGDGYRAWEGLPHVGAVLAQDEAVFEERLARLLGWLGGEVGRRQTVLAQLGEDDVWVRARPEMPPLVVVLDGMAALREGHEMLLENELIPLARRALRVGIVFVFVAQVPNDLPSRLRGLVGEKVTFRQNNRDLYMELVGRGLGEIDEIAGRGAVRVGKRPLLVQVAAVERDLMLGLAERMRRCWHWPEGVSRPNRVEILPERVDLGRLSAERPVIGMTEALGAAVFDLAEIGPHFVILGGPRAGKTTLLRSWICALAQGFAPERVGMVLVDFQDRLWVEGIDSLPHVLGTVSETAEFISVVDHLERWGQGSDRRPREIFVFIDNFDELVEELSFSREGKDLLSLLETRVRHWGREGIHLVVTNGLANNTAGLWRRLLAGGNGFALRSGGALSGLRVTKLPAAVRGDQQLPVGRGYRVNGGEMMLVQIGRFADMRDVVEQIQEKWGINRHGWQENKAELVSNEAMKGDGKAAERRRLLRLLLQEAAVQVGRGERPYEAALAAWQTTLENEDSWNQEAFVWDALHAIWCEIQKRHWGDEFPTDGVDEQTVLLDLWGEVNA